MRTRVRMPALWVCLGARVCLYVRVSVSNCLPRSPPPPPMPLSTLLHTTELLGLSLLFNAPIHAPPPPSPTGATPSDGGSPPGELEAQMMRCVTARVTDTKAQTAT